MRVEKMILEQIEGLEDKVASASMQVPVSFFSYTSSRVLGYKQREGGRN